VSVDSIVMHVVAAIAVIIGVSYATGLLFRRFRQPEVIGQLLAGVVLGPSVLGRFAAGVSHEVFPVKIIPYLNVTAQVALVLFLFAVGYELDLRVLRTSRRAVPVIAATAFIVPALLGIGIAFLFEPAFRRIGEPGAGKPEFLLFIGVAVSITAVPVLASIVGERGIAASVPGVTALASAALIDAAGWLMLAWVLVLASGSSPGHHSWPVTGALLICYVAAGVLVVRPLLRKWLLRRNSVLGDYVPVAVVLAMISAWATAALGLHVIFGALFAGLMMPRHDDGTPDIHLLQPVSQAGRLLLPVFFMVAGLSVNIGTVMRASNFEVLAIVLVVAVLGKLGAGFAASRAAGLGTRDSAVVGALLNTRGLTELIALNIGLAAGIIHQGLYTLLVLMALLTTIATGPLLSLLMPSRSARTRLAEEAEIARHPTQDCRVEPEVQSQGSAD
jgi:Kef-type K+ transport system membrane component KefB